MSFLSSLFGYSDKPATQTKVSYIPPELKPYVDEVLKDTQALYKQRMGEGYTPYTGQTIAGFTPEQLQSQEGLKALVGSQRPYQDEALGIMRGGAEQFTADTAKKFMSPYQRAVIDEEKEQAQRQYERTQRPKFEKDAVAAGGMSGLGTRAAVEAAERETGQQRLLAGIETKGLQKAYEDAQNQFKSQKERERLLASDISQTGQNIFSAGLAEQGLLQGIGEEKRDMQQAGLDEALYKFKQQQQFPEEQLARYMTSIYGNPMLAQPTYTTTKTPQQASMGKSLLGLGLAGYQAGGGFSKGGFSLPNWLKPKAAGGGQVGGLSTLYRQTGGQTNPSIYGGYNLAALQQMGDSEEQEFQTGQTATVKRDPQDFKDARIAAGVEPPAPVKPPPVDQQNKVVGEIVKNVKGKAAAKGDKLPPEFTRKSVAELVAEIKGTKSDALLAGLAAYLKPFGTPADIPGAMLAADRKAQIDAAKEELKMTSEEEKAEARVRAAIAKARGSKTGKYKSTEARNTWKDIALSEGFFKLGADGKTISINRSLYGKNPNQTKKAINKILTDAQKIGERTGVQSDATEYITKAFGDLLAKDKKARGGEGAKPPAKPPSSSKFITGQDGTKYEKVMQPSGKIGYVPVK
jgi:hypothetical protein